MTAGGLAALATVVAAACVIPPTQSTLGAVGTADGVGTRASIGAHASALDDRSAATVDLGAGWVVEDVAARGAAHGTYVALARRLDRAIWIGGRGELFWGVTAGQPRRALVARAALRRRLAGVRWGAGDGGGALGVLGVLATGAYLDLGARQLEGGAAEVFVAAGVSVDLPALAGASR
ncbi:MAG: hypothetical protein IPL61_18265 [Myxococcales bacterium]|nr:hypothetical protein [Myxococcales bacterium]